MIKVIVRATLLTLMSSLFLHATSILKNDILKLEVTNIIDQIGAELFEKTGISEYVIATNERFPVGFNLVAYSKKYAEKMRKPYVLFIFAPQAKITHISEEKGRVGIIPSEEMLKKLYDYDDVRDAAIDVVAVRDKNTQEDKDNIGVLQAFSELAEGIAESKNVELESAIPNDTRHFIFLLKILVYFGSSLVLWMFIFRPIWIRIKNGK